MSDKFSKVMQDCYLFSHCAVDRLNVGGMRRFRTRHSRQSGRQKSRQARQSRKAMKANKADPHDASGLAQLARTGFDKEVHVKALAAHGVRSVITPRAHLVENRVRLNNMIRGLCATFGCKPGAWSSSCTPGVQRHVSADRSLMPSRETPPKLCKSQSNLIAALKFCLSWTGIGHLPRREWGWRTALGVYHPGRMSGRTGGSQLRC